MNEQTTIHVGIISFAHTAHAISYASALSTLEGVKLAGIADDNPARLDEYCRHFQVPGFATPQELLSQPGLDAVVVCSETNRHLGLVTLAAAAGKHILCEKPIATTLADARAMIDLCARAGVLLQIPFVCRFYPMVQSARRMVLAGDFGKIIGLIGGNRGVPPLPPVYPEWITDPVQAGGGALLDHSVHVTDAMRFIFADEVDSVFAETCTIHDLGLAVDEGGLLSLRFHSGMIATVDPSWSNPANNPHHYDFYLRVLGEKGTIQLDDTRQALPVVSDKPGCRPVSEEPCGLDVDRAMIAHFIRCVRAGENLFPAASGKDGLRALEIALAAYRSAESHQPVQLVQEENLS